MTEAARVWSTRHDVQFYDHDYGLASNVARFLDEGIRAAQPCIIIATPAHRRGIMAYLRTIGVDVDSLVSSQILWLDARETLSSFMEGNRPNAELFAATVGNVFEKMTAARRYVTVRAFGEMVDLLWREGRSDAALELEELWNGLASTYSFALLCAYDRQCVSGPGDVERISRAHTHVVRAD